MSKEPRVKIPNYCLAEELINSISHGIGALLGIAALVLCIVYAAIKSDAWAVVGVSIYGATLVILYTISTIYHALKINKAKRVFRVLDHCSVFLMIAGTYTPYTLVTLHGTVGWVIFGIVWGCTILGIVFNSIDVDKYKNLSIALNLIVGWVVIVAFKPLLASLGVAGVVLLIIGGVLYSIGAGLYAIGHRVKFSHSIFHFFVVAGSICHFFSIFFYVI